MIVNDFVRSRVIFWLQWTIAVVVGFLASAPIVSFFVALIAPAQNDLFLVNIVLQGLTSGLVISLLEWYLLRKRIRHSGRWILWNTIGFVFGFYETHSRDFGGVNNFVRLIVFGFILGVAQAWAFSMELNRAWFWLIIANIVGWSIGGLIGEFIGNTWGGFWFYLIAGLIAGISSGYAMIRILPGFAPETPVPNS